MRTVFALFGVLVVVVTACKSHTVIDTHRRSAAHMTAGDAVVILSRGQPAGQVPDHDFVTCVGNALGRQKSTLSIIGEQEFVDALYPWFETTTAPSDVALLESLFENEAVTRKMSAMSVKYLVWISGSTERLDERGSVSCTVGPGGGGCFGLKIWEDEAEYEASVWDLDDKVDTGKIGTRTSGTSYLPAVIIPVPLLARVKTTACDEMANQIAKYLGQ